MKTVQRYKQNLTCASLPTFCRHICRYLLLFVENDRAHACIITAYKSNVLQNVVSPSEDT